MVNIKTFTYMMAAIDIAMKYKSFSLSGILKLKLYWDKNYTN